MNPTSSPMPRRCGWSATLALGVFLLATTPARPANLLERLFPHDVNVITATDVFSPRLRGTPTSPDHPVYYVAASAGYRDFGFAMNGDKRPARQDMVRTISRVLAKAGYLPADAQHPATQAILYTWGTLNPHPGDIYLNFQRPQLDELLFIGANKLGLTTKYPEVWTGSLLPGLARYNPEARFLINVASSNLYVVAVLAFQYPMKNPRHPKLLWQTKISCPSDGLVMANTLPTMVAIATPYIGRETGRPVWVDASRKFKPHVEIGNPKVEQYLDSGAAPWPEHGVAPTKAEKPN